MNIYGILNELFFPTRCAGCGSYSGRPICPLCNASLPRISGAVCRRCGKPAIYNVDECLECRERIRHLDATVALGVYKEPLRSVIHKLKYANGWRLAPPLGAMAAARLAPALGTSRPLVTFVPMHRHRRRERGYDHAEILAGGVAKALGLSVVTLLRRVRSTRAQSSLSHEGRRANVRGAFEAVGADLRGEHIVLVDDVLTTGYTVSECSAILKRRGADRITACVLARDLLGIDSPSGK